MKKKLLALIFTVIPLFLVFGVAKADTVKIVSDTSYAPFEFQDTDKVYKGIDVDLMKEAAKINGWDLQMSFPGFDAAVNALNAGQADGLMAGVTVTKERKKVYDFSDPYYATSIVIATSNKHKVSKYSQLKGKTVGVKNGTAAQSFLQKIQDKYDFKLKTFETDAQMFNSLDTGDIYALMDDKPVLQYAISQGRKMSINMKGESIGNFAFAIKKGDSKNKYLITGFNKALKQMKKDGTYDKIIDKWLSSDSTSTKEDKENASKKATPKKATYTIVSDSSFAPFEFQNDDNKYVGIDMEIIKAIAKQQGFNIQIKNPGFDAAINAVQSGQADGIIAGMSITDARKKTFDFSNSYYTANAILAVKKNSDISSYKDLKGKVVGVKNGTASQTFIQENAKKYGYTVKTFDQSTQMYDSLNTGSINALMDDEPVVKYAIKEGKQLKTPIKGEKIGEYGFAVKKGTNPELIQMFNYGLANLKESGQYQKIVNNYLASNKSSQSSQTKAVDESTWHGLIQNNYKQLLKGLGITVALTIISFILATIFGIIIGMLGVSPIKGLRAFSSIIVDIFRGIPLMIVAAFIFWGLPNLIESITGNQSPINDFVAGVIALTLNEGVYIAEIVRGGIEAVPKGQMEASRSLGIPYSKTMRKIILPQASRIMLPNFINQFVITLKDTTIISAIGLVELFQTGKIIIARNYQSFKMYAILAVLYLVIITILTRFAKRLEKRSK